MISDKVLKKISGPSWIRAMFEQGEVLKKKYGADKVYDFSLGNPDLEPPEETLTSLRNLVNSQEPNLHKYMNNAGYPEVREKIARHIAKDTGISLTQKHIIMTCGAAGGLNVVLKTVINPGDEVIVLAPYFGEYSNYIDNFDGKMVVSQCNMETFQPDLENLESKISSDTKAILLNSPNNPTGAIYGESILRDMAELISKKEREFGSNILVISDEPYTQLVYDGETVPSVLKIFPNSVIVNSFSKSLNLPGDRIGYIAVNSSVPDIELFFSGLSLSNRILGFVNAPALFQRVIADSLEAKINTEIYLERRDFLYHNLTRLGFSCVKPKGAFYLFPKVHMEDDVEFVQRALAYNLLLVPGSSFGGPGHVRISYSVSTESIKNSIPAFEALAAEFNK
ncbi:MAG: pyridoxal phosphate-dependent aminotransferase [Clostridiales bacterium]|nr:pyridoxal phosphate-dependent aminotransferase [Clostridiales bacterium]